jgi:hypothetical protein
MYQHSLFSQLSCIDPDNPIKFDMDNCTDIESEIAEVERFSREITKQAGSYNKLKNRFFKLAEEARKLGYLN